LQSLARDQPENAVAVILSGTGNDGCLGARALRDAGGRVLCESLETAKFYGMPQAILDAHIEDFVGTPGELAKAAITRSGGAPPKPSEAALGRDHARILELIQDSHGVDFGRRRHGVLPRPGGV
jgi:two-component system CheB/CheR fusion protein